MYRLRAFLFVVVLALVVSLPAQSDQSARTERQNQSLVDELRATVDTGSLTLGHVLYVDSSRGFATAPGTKAQPYNSIGAALSRLLALEDAEGTNFVYDNVIYVYPEHAETLTAASSETGNTVTGIYVSLDGTKIIGLGDGTDKAQITLGTATTTDIEITAANVTFENFEVTQGITALATTFTIGAGADNLTLKDIEFTKSGTLATDTVDWISVAAGADDLTLDGLVARFSTTGTVSVTLVEFAGANARPAIKNCATTVAFSDAAVDGDGIWSDATFLGNAFAGAAFARTSGATEYTDYGTPDGLPWNFIYMQTDLAAAPWVDQATNEIFTVTGDVRFKLLVFASETGDDTSGSTATVAFGSANGTAGTDVIAATVVDIIAAGDVWVDATPTEVLSNLDLDSGFLDFLAVDGADYGILNAGEAATAGILEWHAYYHPVLDGGTVAAGAGGTL